MEYTIEQMTEAHLAPLAAIEKACFSTPWSEEGLREELFNPQAHFLVADCGGTVAGYIGVQEIFGEAYVTNVAVLPEYRKKGIAFSLLQAALAGAKERDCIFLSLEVRQSNVPAISLYEKCNFTKVGTRKNFYRAPAEDAYIYTFYFKETSV